MRKVERIMICTLIVLGIIFTNTPIKAASNEATANGVEYPTLEEALEIGGEVTLLEDEHLILSQQ